MRAAKNYARAYTSVGARIFSRRAFNEIRWLAAEARPHFFVVFAHIFSHRGNPTAHRCRPMSRIGKPIAYQ
jgi:hypothetical protein